MKYRVNFTKKIEFTDGKFDGFHYAEFKTKAEAQKFITKKKKSIYWHELVETHPKSKHPKFIVSKDDPSLSEYIRIEGNLETYFETGMEATGLAFYRGDIAKGPLNPNYDPSKPESGANFKHYKSHDGLIFISQGHILELDGELIFMMKDIDFARADGFGLTFYPRGFFKEEWIKLFIPEGRKAALWVKKTSQVLQPF